MHIFTCKSRCQVKFVVTKTSYSMLSNLVILCLTQNPCVLHVKTLSQAQGDRKGGMRVAERVGSG